MFNYNLPNEDAENIDERVARVETGRMAMIVFVLAMLFIGYTGLNLRHYMTVRGDLDGRIITTREITRSYVQRGGRRVPDRYYLCYRDGGEKCVSVDYIVGKSPVGTKFDVIEVDDRLYHISDPGLDALDMNFIYFLAGIAIAVFSLLKWMFPQALTLKNFVSPPTTKLFDK